MLSYSSGHLAISSCRISCTEPPGQRAKNSKSHHSIIANDSKDPARSPLELANPCSDRETLKSQNQVDVLGQVTEVPGGRCLVPVAILMGSNPPPAVLGVDDTRTSYCRSKARLSFAIRVCQIGLIHHVAVKASAQHPTRHRSEEHTS